MKGKWVGRDILEMEKGIELLLILNHGDVYVTRLEIYLSAVPSESSISKKVFSASVKTLTRRPLLFGLLKGLNGNRSVSLRRESSLCSRVQLQPLAEHSNHHIVVNMFC